MGIPLFKDQFSYLDRFIVELVDAHQAGDIQSWEDLEPRVTNFFTPERMAQVEACVPGWQKMSSYHEGVTLTHVMCVFMGLYMLPEFADLPPAQQNMMQWVILFHDVEKEVEKGRRDPKHGFRSAVVAAQNLPKLGFDTTQDYEKLIDAWSEFTYSAVITPAGAREPIQDNRKLAEILSGINQLFGRNSPGALIVKTVLLHMSINVVKEWPQAVPLSMHEIVKYIGKDLVPLLKSMMLADNEGWVMFHPEEREIQRRETLETFEVINNMIF